MLSIANNIAFSKLGIPTRSLVLGAAALSCAAVAPHFPGPSLAVMAVILLASLTSSIAGFAFSAVCGAVLFHLLGDRVQVVQIMMTCSIANQGNMVWALRRDIVWRQLQPYLLGGVLGLPLGVWLLLHADRAAFATALGLFLLAYSLYMLLVKPRRVQLQHPALDAFSGFLGGITGGAVGFPGAAVTIWSGLQGWDKTRQRALFQPFILIMQIAALLTIGLLQSRRGQAAGFDVAALLYVPAGLLGTQLGMSLYQKLSTRQFALAVNLLLLVSGLSFLL